MNALTIGLILRWMSDSLDVSVYPITEFCSLEGYL